MDIDKEQEEMNKTKLGKALFPFGFIPCDGVPWFKHILIAGKVFDFSACSIHGVMLNVYKVGVEEGRRQVQEELRKTLGIEEKEEY